MFTFITAVFFALALSLSFYSQPHATHISGWCCTRFSGFLLPLYHAVLCRTCLCFCFNIILFGSFSIGLGSVCACVCALCFACARVFCFRIFACWVNIAIHMVVIAAIRQVCAELQILALVHREKSWPGIFIENRTKSMHFMYASMIARGKEKRERWRRGEFFLIIDCMR